jgi:PilZ domain
VFLCSAVSSARSGERGHCLDLSEAGAGLVVAGSWQPGQVMQLELVLPRAERPLMLAARMVHRNRQFCGMEFLGLTESARARLRSALHDIGGEAPGGEWQRNVS